VPKPAPLAIFLSICPPSAAFWGRPAPRQRRGSSRPRKSQPAPAQTPPNKRGTTLPILSAAEEISASAARSGARFDQETRKCFAVGENVL
jgi:hypothetical protein